MSTEDDIGVLIAARDDETLCWQPTNDLPRAALAAEQRHRRRRTAWLAAASAVVVAGAVTVPVAIAHSGHGGASDRIVASPSPSPSSVIKRAADFTVGYLPPGYRYLHREDVPLSVAADATRSYALHGDPQKGVIWVEAQYGLVDTLAQYRRYVGPLRSATVAGHPAVIGWNTGNIGEGIHLLYVLLDAHTSLTVSERPAVGGAPLPDAQLEQIAAAVTVTTSGPANATIVIPDVRGLSQQAAVNALLGAGAGVPVVEDQYGTKVPRDHVVSQSPAPGTRVPQGSTVTLMVAG